MSGDKKKPGGGPAKRQPARATPDKANPAPANPAPAKPAPAKPEKGSPQKRAPGAATNAASTVARETVARETVARETGIPKSGFVGRVILRLLLLFIVLSEVTFLASRNRVRFDLTSDELYTLTASTEKVLTKLDDLLVIEAYFSPKQTLPILQQPLRMALVNLLEEYEKLGRGKVKVKFIDPLENKRTRETAERLGMTPQQAQLTGSASVTSVEIWQGFRLRYGSKKKEVIPFMPFPQRQHPTGFYERILTPLVKRLTVNERPKIGVLSFRSRPGGPGMVISMEKKSPPRGFDLLSQAFAGEYDLQNIDISKGQLIPPEIKIALLIRPKYLSDRTKFVFDQFLMRGGNLVVFADTTEVEVREDRAFRGTVVPYDAANAKYRFTDMLKAYGVEVRNQIVAEGVRNLQQLFFDIRQDRASGQRFRNPLPYPFIFEAADEEWANRVDQMARRSDGTIDPALAEQYKKLVKPGMEKDHDLIRAIAGLGAPGMFWPCPVELQPELPTGVEGRVLLRTSPFAWTEPPNAPLDPFDEAGQWQQRDQNIRRWTASKQLMIPPSPNQISLMVHLTGSFPSFFADKEIPPSPDEVAQPKKEPDPKKSPDKVEDWGADPKKDAEKDAEKDTATPDTEAKPALPPTAEPEKATPPETIEKLDVAKASASLLVIGDATFLRDDFFSALYAQANAEHMIELVGPVDRMIEAQRPQRFMKNLLDWLAQERDLQALQNKTRTDRTMTFLVPNEAAQETVEEFNERLGVKHSIVRWTNAVGPAVLLLLFGLAIWLVRRSKKKAFLASI